MTTLRPCALSFLATALARVLLPEEGIPVSQRAKAFIFLSLEVLVDVPMVYLLGLKYVVYEVEYLSSGLVC